MRRTSLALTALVSSVTAQTAAEVDWVSWPGTIYGGGTFEFAWTSSNIDAAGVRSSSRDVLFDPALRSNM
jgi:hypothetical protein